jgi:hypothetical protein
MNRPLSCRNRWSLKLHGNTADIAVLQTPDGLVLADATDEPAAGGPNSFERDPTTGLDPGGSAQGAGS